MTRIHLIFLIISTCCLFFSRCLAQDSLSYYLKQAQENNPVIFENRNLVKANQLEAERLKAEFLKPQITLTSDLLIAPYFNNHGNYFSTTPSDQAIGYAEAISNGGLYTALLNFTQPLFNSVRYDTHYHQVLVQNETYRYAIRQKLHELHKDITDQYILVYKDQQLIQNSNEIVGLLGEQLKVAKKLVNAGITKRTDYILLDIEHQARQAELLNNRTSYFNDLITLDTLAKVSRIDTVVLAKPDIALTPRPDSLSNFLHQYTLDSLKIVTDQQVSNLTYKPQLDAKVDGGLNAVELANIQHRLGFSAGLSFTWLIFDGHQKRLNERKNQFAQESVQFYRQKFLDQYQHTQQKIRQALSVLNERIDLLEGQLDDYQQVIRDYQQQVASGQVSVIDYINTIKSYMLLKNDLITAESDRMTLMNHYNYWNW